MIAPLLAAMAALSVCILVIIIAFLLKESWPVLAGGNWWGLISDTGWYPLEDRFGMMPMILATLVAAAGAVLLAVPLGLASAVFEVFFAPPAVAKIYHLLIALLAGIPSVVYGLWGLTVLVPMLAALQPPGASLLAAILILALMILPTVALTSTAALTNLPPAWLRGAAALGLS
ncbi:MAG: hypothetical protein WD601_09245, partial [Pseudohongiellaceae bacterium]